jgi:hypothetical protein
LESSSVLSEHEYTIKLCTLLFHLNWLLSHPQRHFAKRISPPPFGTQAWPEFPPFSMISPSSNHSTPLQGFPSPPWWVVFAVGRTIGQIEVRGGPVFIDGR